MESIKRKVYFYKYTVQNSNDSYKTPFSLIKDAFTEINQLPYSEEGRYLKLESFKSLSCEVSGISDKLLKGKIGYRRTGDLPLKEKGGKITTVGLMKDESLFEPTHFIFFKSGILAVEYNHFGPRTGSIKNYLLSKSELIDRVLFSFLYKDSASEIIASISELYEIDIVASADNIGVFAELNNSLYSGFKALKKAVGNSEKLKFSISRNANSQFGINVKWLDKLPKWFSSDGHHEIVHKFKIKAILEGGDKAKLHDLLEDKFIHETEVIKQDGITRAVDSSNMFNQMIKAYNSLRDDLTRAF